MCIGWYILYIQYRVDVYEVLKVGLVSLNVWPFFGSPFLLIFTRIHPSFTSFFGPDLIIINKVRMSVYVVRVYVVCTCVCVCIYIS